MNETIITCPHCHQSIPLTEALTSRLHAQYEAELTSRLETAVAEAERRKQQELEPRLAHLQRQLHQQTEKASETEQRELALREKTLALETQQQTLVERTRLEVEERLRKEAEEKTKQLVTQTEQKVRQETTLERQMLETQLVTAERKAAEALKAELELRQKAEALEDRQRNLDLEVARRLDGKKAEWEASLRQSVTEEHALKLKEKEKQIADLKEHLNELNRKASQGSQELQGEVLEIDIQAGLERQFPQDLIRPVPKGMQGADLIQEVRDLALQGCGQIIWEFKNTKHWQPAWIDKLKADQREANAAIAILVSVTLPEGVRGFTQMNGVWICTITHYPALAVALREQLVHVAFARAASHGKGEKMELLYHYLAGDEFKHRVEAIVDAFTTLRDQLDREKRALNKHWAEREKQIERVIQSTTGMYGSLQGIIGKSLPVIAALELDEVPLLEEAP